MIAGEIEVELVPQGTLAERIRAGGFGLGGVLTATGIGTLVERGQAHHRDRRAHASCSRLPLRADFALIGARQADYLGNLEYSLTAHNFNPIMAMAASVVIAEPEDDRAGRRASRPIRSRRRASPRRTTCSAERGMSDDKEIIARRVAQELHDGGLVNLGIGLPTLVAHYLPRGIAGLLPVRKRHRSAWSRRPTKGMEDPDLDRRRRRLHHAPCPVRVPSTARCPSGSSAAATST